MNFEVLLKFLSQMEIFLRVTQPLAFCAITQIFSFIKKFKLPIVLSEIAIASIFSLSVLISTCTLYTRTDPYSYCTTMIEFVSPYVADVTKFLITNTIQNFVKLLKLDKF